MEKVLLGVGAGVFPYSVLAALWLGGRTGNGSVVLLIPARTDTTYFHDFIMNRAEIRFIKGRLKFGGGKDPAPFPSMLAIFRGPKM